MIYLSNSGEIGGLPGSQQHMRTYMRTQQCNVGTYENIIYTKGGNLILYAMLIYVKDYVTCKSVPRLTHSHATSPP